MDNVRSETSDHPITLTRVCAFCNGPIEERTSAQFHTRCYFAWRDGFQGLPTRPLPEEPSVFEFTESTRRELVRDLALITLLLGIGLGAIVYFFPTVFK